MESLKVVLIKMIAILMISAKWATLGSHRINLFWNKSHGILFSIDEITNKILTSDSNYDADMAMSLKFGNSSISIRDFQFYNSLNRKPNSLRCGLGSSSIIWN